MSDDDRKEFRHESYVLAGFSRITGSTGQLFGSSLPNQGTFIRFRVCPGKREHHLSQDWYSQDGGFNEGRDYIEIDFSPAQFAELLTTMNVGSGVPCTLRYLGGRKVDNPPSELLEAEQVREGFAETAKGLADRLRIFEGRMKEIFDKKTAVTQKDKEELRSAYAMVVQQVSSNMPFVVEQFHKAAGKIITHAKAEVDAFMTHAVLAAGLKAIAEGHAAPLSLPEKSDQ